VLRIDFGPGTVGTPGSESLKPGLFVVGLSLTVNPSIAKRLIEGLGIVEGFLAGSFLKKAEPNSIRLTVVASEPVPKCRRGWKALYLLSHDFEFWAILHNTVAVFQSRVVSATESLFSKALFESFIFRIRPGSNNRFRGRSDEIGPAMWTAFPDYTACSEREVRAKKSSDLTLGGPGGGIVRQ
jgi:hypothetical protein